MSSHRTNAKLPFDDVAHRPNSIAVVYKLSLRLFFISLFIGTVATQTALCQSPQEPLSANRDAMWGNSAPATYKILPRPASGLHSHKSPHTQVDLPPKLESKPIQPYAYGWFGTKPSNHWYRQFGHQNSYTQWTLR